MTANDILESMPHTVPWFVLFRLEPFRAVAEPTTLQAMFKLASIDSLDGSSHILLTPAGPVSVDMRTGHLKQDQGLPIPSISPADSIKVRYQRRLRRLPPTEPDCLGFANLGQDQLVLLHVTLSDLLVGRAVAHLPTKPQTNHYDLLAAVGVRYLRGEWRDDVFEAVFENRLTQHLLAAALAGFSRTERCNQFFFNACRVTEDIRSGLESAHRDRTARGRERTLRALRNLSDATLEHRLSLTAIPPAPMPPYPYGDLVPLGFVLQALRTDITTKGSLDRVERVRQHLLANRQDGLWSYHTGGLPTATDTVLVSQGMFSDETAPALEQFRDRQAWGFLPQLAEATPATARHMAITPGNKHWCQPDYPTTCLALAELERSGRPVTGDDVQPLADRFPTRSGLFFANPYLVDLALAKLLGNIIGSGGTDRNDGLRRELTNRLVAELTASMNPDGSFGTFDPWLSTSAAILALAELNAAPHHIRAGQLRLLSWIEEDGTLPTATPFYSSHATQRGPESSESSAADHAITWYCDPHRLITTACAVLALSAQPSPGDPDQATDSAAVSHPRYRVGIESYVREYAIPTYLGTRKDLCGAAQTQRAPREE